MATTNNNEEPCLININQGSSTSQTIYYKNKYLYSKYDPPKSITLSIDNMTILEGSVFLLCSPCLWYGIDALLRKLPQNCFLIALERDPKLLTLASQKRTSIPLFSGEDLQNLDSLLRNKIASGKYKRIIRIDFSAGTTLYQSFYDMVYDGCQNIVSTFWKNRLTLTRIGKLYSKNIFKNLPSLSNSKQLKNVENTVHKPILVIGAGQSLDDTLKNNFNLKKFYIICVDAAFQALSSRNIRPNAIVSVEGQFAIQKSYIGTNSKDLTLFADICSRNEITDYFSDNVVYFESEFCTEPFFKILKDNNVFNSILPPMGSVGLYAIYIALKIRLSTSVPIYFTGMDFSFTPGFSHAKQTSAHRAQLYNNNRFTSIENYMAFNPNSITLKGKKDRIIYTTPVMASYAKQFSYYFSRTENLYDIGQFGINTGCPTQSLLIAEETKTTFPLLQIDNSAKTTNNQFVKEYLENRKQDLEQLKKLLTSEIPDSISNDELIKLMKNNSYLYMHFPDGHEPTLEISFLKRIRAEIDYFYKIINSALKKLIDYN